MVQSVEHIACSFPSFLLLSGSRSLWVPRCCCLCYLLFYIILSPPGAGWFLFRVHHLCVTLVVILSLRTGCYCIIIFTPYYILYSVGVVGSLHCFNMSIIITLWTALCPYQMQSQTYTILQRNSGFDRRISGPTCLLLQLPTP